MKIKNTRISYTSTGRGNTTLLFIHGSFLKKEYWKEQIKYFSSDYKVIAIDLPGHGDSGKGSSALTYSYLGEVVSEFIDQLKVRKVILIGHSMGADVALEAAIRNPEPIIGIVAIDHFKNAGAEVPSGMLTQLERDLHENFKGTVEGFAGKMLLTAHTPEFVRSRVIADYRNMDPEGGIENIREAFIYFAREAALLQKLRLKLHLINVDYLPTDESLLHKNTSEGFDVRYIHGTSHFPMIEEPDQLNSYLTQVIPGIAHEAIPQNMAAEIF